VTQYLSLGAKERLINKLNTTLDTVDVDDIVPLAKRRFRPNDFVDPVQESLRACLAQRVDLVEDPSGHPPPGRGRRALDRGQGGLGESSITPRSERSTWLNRRCSMGFHLKV
jgi:hypothetical protein